MPDQPLPNDPRFGFFDERPDQRLSDDEDQLDRFPTDEANPVRAVSLVYPTRDNDFEMREIERLMAENEALRGLLPDVETVEEAHEIFTEWAAAYAAIGNIEKDNERLNSKLFRARIALARIYTDWPVPAFMAEWLAPLRAILERE